MKERIINIRVSFDMNDIPEGSTINPKEKVEELVSTEMNDLFGYDEGFNGVEVEVIDKDYDEPHAYDDYDENFDPWESNTMKFIWGVKSWDDLCNCDACLYTMNDIDLIYLKDENKYILGIETIFGFEKEEHKLGYLKECLDAFTKFMVENGYNTEVKPQWWDVFMSGMNTHFDSIEECYGMFKMLVNGYCNMQEVDIYE